MEQAQSEEINTEKMPEPVQKVEVGQAGDHPLTKESKPAPPLERSQSQPESKQESSVVVKKPSAAPQKQSAKPRGEEEKKGREETKHAKPELKRWDRNWPEFDYSTLQSAEDNESLGVYFDQQTGWRRCSFMYFLVEVPTDLLAQVSLKLQQHPEVDNEPTCELLDLPAEDLGLSPNLRVYRFTSKKPFKEFKAFAYLRRTVWKDSTYHSSNRNPKAVKEMPQQFVFQTNIQLPRNTMTSVPKYAELTYYALYLLTATDAAMTLPRLIDQFKTHYPPSHPGWSSGFEMAKTQSNTPQYSYGTVYTGQPRPANTSSYATSPYYAASPSYGGSSYGGYSYSGGYSYGGAYGGNTYYGASAAYGGGGYSY